MSGILRSVKKIIVVLAGGAWYLAGISLILVGYPASEILVILVSMAATGTFALHWAIRRRMRQQVKPFTAGSKIRNVDYLVIGGRAAETFEVKEGGAVVRLSAPSRSLTSSYELLRHTYGILKPGGTAVLIAGRKEGQNSGFTVYDLPVLELSPLSVRRLHLERLKKTYFLHIGLHIPEVVLYLWGRGKPFHLECRDCPVTEIADFCIERGIVLTYYSAED